MNQMKGWRVAVIGLVQLLVLSCSDQGGKSKDLAGTGGTTSAGGGATALGGNSTAGGQSGGAVTGGPATANGSSGSGGGAGGGGTSAGAAGNSVGGAATNAQAGATSQSGGGATSDAQGGASGGTANAEGSAGAEMTGEGGAADSGADAGMAGASSDATVATITELTIEPNPTNVLSCFVSWKTDVATGSTVQFGVDSYEWEVTDPTPVTEHRMLVIGMHASETYTLKATSGTATAEDTFTTGTLPDTIPVGTVTIHDEALTQPGWTLMNVQEINPSNAAVGSVIPNSPYPPQAVIYDSEGEPVWYYISGSAPDNGGAIDVELTDKGVLIGPSWNSQLTNAEPPREVDFAGNILWECQASICGPGESISHHAGKLSNGNYVLIEDITTNGIKNPIFHEVTPDNEIVWTLEWTKFVTPPADVTGDWCHGNSITIDIDRDEVYANCRWFGVLKTTYNNPTYQWLLPASCASKGLGDFTFTGSQFIDSHDPEIHPDDNTILFFDNGGWTTRCAADEYHSRVVEYELDGTSATLVWEFPGDFQVDDPWYADWYSPYWGDADRLENGNVLVAGGVLAASMESRVFEVSKADGKIVWEFRLPNFYGMYRADRIVPPLVHAIAQ